MREPSLIAFPIFQTFPSSVHELRHSFRTTAMLIDAMQNLQGLAQSKDTKSLIEVQFLFSFSYFCHNYFEKWNDTVFLNYICSGWGFISVPWSCNCCSWEQRTRYQPLIARTLFSQTCWFHVAITFTEAYVLYMGQLKSVHEFGQWKYSMLGRIMSLSIWNPCYLIV